MWGLHKRLYLIFILLYRVIALGSFQQFWYFLVFRNLTLVSPGATFQCWGSLQLFQSCSSTLGKNPEPLKQNIHFNSFKISIPPPVHVVPGWVLWSGKSGAPPRTTCNGSIVEIKIIFVQMFTYCPQNIGHLSSPGASPDLPEDKKQKLDDQQLI